MQKVSFYGLSRSGKSCYIFAMSQALSQGIKFSDNKVLSVVCPEPRQVIRLYKAYQQMATGIWPKGNIESVDYRFNCTVALENLMSIGITDYRGGLLDSIDEDEEEEQKSLFDSFLDSSVLLFFIGADSIKDAMNGDRDSFEEGGIPSSMKISFMNTLYNQYRERAQTVNTPIMIVISKSDMLSESELVKAKEYIKKTLQVFFQSGTGITTAITAVTLGRNLSNYNGELEGELIIGPTSGNIHVPVLYSLYNVVSSRIEESTGLLDSAQNSVVSARQEMTREKARNPLVRFLFGNEKEIQRKIDSSTQTVGSEKEKLQKLYELLNNIRPLLLSGAEVYIDGKRQF